MSNSEKKDPLLDWNRINIENAEQGFVSALYQSISETTTAADNFSLWLLAGTGATGALLISQIESILPFLTSEGFKVCMVILVISAVFGFVAKYKALRCEIQLLMQTKLQELMEPIFAKHEEAEDKIQEYASQRGIEIESEMNFANIISEFSKPFPWWGKLLMARQLKKADGDRQAGHRVAFKAYIGQLRWTFFQACFFLAFMLVGTWYASAI
jgi:hypothetical protein